MNKIEIYCAGDGTLFYKECDCFLYEKYYMQRDDQGNVIYRGVNIR